MPPRAIAFEPSLLAQSQPFNSTTCHQGEMINNEVIFPTVQRFSTPKDVAGADFEAGPTAQKRRKSILLRSTRNTCRASAELASQIHDALVVGFCTSIA